MDMLPSWTGAVVGLLVGIAVGFVVRRGRLCTFGAIEDAVTSGDRRRLKVFGLALGLALIATQSLVLSGAFDPHGSTYVPAQLAWAGIFGGSLLFGLGMALVGTCAFGSLVRLGGGDLRSLVVLLIYGAIAFATLRGVLATLRIDVVERMTVPMPGGDLPGLIEALSGWSLHGPLMIVLGGWLIATALRDRRLWRARRLLTAGVVLGLAIPVGWIVTGVFIDPFDEPQRAQSLSFVGPVAKLLYGLIAGATDLLDYAVWTVAGVVAGSALAAVRAGEARWEAFDDHHEMRRHLIGACLMGLGGTLAGGCTIGQGLTAGSLLAPSWFLAVGGLVLGARLGIAILVGGVSSLWPVRSSARRV